MAEPPDKLPPQADLKDALDNLKEAVEFFCLAYGEARQGACPLGAGLEALERGLSEEDDLLRHPPLAEKRAAIERHWQEWLRIPRNREARVEIALADHHGHGVLLCYARRLGGEPPRAGAAPWDPLRHPGAWRRGPGLLGVAEEGLVAPHARGAGHGSKTGHEGPRRQRRRGFRPAGKAGIVTQGEAGRHLPVVAHHCLTTAREDWQTGVIASYLKMANPALLGDFTIG